jgi:membrane protease YdiL (CAAX protease family)
MKNLSDRAEFAIVISVAFGYFIFVSVFYAINLDTQTSVANDSGLGFLILYEAVVLLLLTWFLFSRGWRAQGVGLVFHRQDPVVGLGLAVFAYAAYYILYALAVNVVPDAVEARDWGSNLTPGSVIIVSILNPVFEELFVCGYVISYFKRSGRSLSFAVNVSVAIRLAYHLYQGAFSVISIVPMGLAFTYWFARTGRLWPVIIAHAILDFIALIVYV